MRKMRLRSTALLSLGRLIACFCASFAGVSAEDLKFPICSEWVKIRGKEGIVKADFSSNHSVWLLDDGKVVCLGLNSHGECLVPELGGKKCVDVAAGAGFSLALMEDGTLINWGIQIPGLAKSRVSRVVAAEEYVNISCEDGTIECRLSHGNSPSSKLSAQKSIRQILPGPNCTYVANDETVGGLSSLPEALSGGAVKIIAGGESRFEANYAFTGQNGLLDGLGMNWRRPDELAQCHALAWEGRGVMAGSFEQHLLGWWWPYGQAARLRLGRDSVRGLAVGTYGAVVITKPGGLYAYGCDRYGALRLTKSPRAVKRVRCSMRGGAVVICDDGLPVWLWNAGETAGLMPIHLRSVVDAASCNNLICAVKPDGSIEAWGRNGRHQCDIPGGLPKIKEIAVGHDFIVGLTADGFVHCFGDNWRNKCTPPAGLRDVVQVVAGNDFAAALTSSGEVIQWGEINPSDPPPAAVVPRPVDSGKFTRISAGDSHIAALTESGRVVAWGANNKGQCSVPDGLKNISEIAAGNEFSAALDRNGSIVAWGPVSIPEGLPKMKSISAGYGIIAGITTDDELVIVSIDQGFRGLGTALPYGVFKTWERRR